MLEVSVSRRLTAALEEGNGKTPSWLQWEEEQTLNGIKEWRKQLHTEMASIQRWVHISRKYTYGLTKIHEGSEERCLPWEIQNSKAQDLRLMVWGQHNGLRTPSRIPGFIKGWDAHGEDFTRPPYTSHSDNQRGHPAGDLRPRRLQTPTVEQLPRTKNINKSKSWSCKMHFFKLLKFERILQMGWQPESGRKRQKQEDTSANICGTSLEAGEVAVDGRTNVTPIYNSSSREDQGN